MADRVKLTKAQAETLRECAKGPYSAYAGYKPAQKLVELGLAERHEGRFSSGSLHITPAGLAFIACLEAEGQW